MRRKISNKPIRRDAKPLQSEPVLSQKRPLSEFNERVLEELLQLALDLPMDASEEEILSLCIDRLARALPENAVGVIVQRASGEGPRILARMPGGALEAPKNDRLRLFPEATRETVAALAGVPGSTLHIASTELSMLGADPALESPFIERAAEVISKGILRARNFEQAQRANLELRRLQAQFIQAEKLASLGQIAAGVVHELNNPLTSITTYSGYLLERAIRSANSEDVERLRRISEAAERVLRFSRDLVAYARPGRHEPRAIDLCEVIEKALVFCEHEFVEHHVVVERRLPPELPATRGVFDQLTQVFVNLFTNAAHAMHEHGGTLRVSAVADYTAERLLVEVADEGAGIAPTDLEQIFEPFFTTKPDGQGTGLGLSIVREIVQAHGGTLRAQSIPGRGSAFSLELPMAAGEVPPPEIADIPTRS